MMRICQTLKIVHPDYLYEALSERQLQDWVDFYDCEPWGTPVADYYAGLITWGAIAGKPGIKSKHTPDDYLPKWGGRSPVNHELYKLKARATYNRINEGLTRGGKNGEGRQ